MKRRDLPIYGGPNHRCAQCNKEFHQEEIIYFDKLNGLIFCYSEEIVNCVSIYALTKAKKIKVNPNIFIIPEKDKKPWHIDVFEKLMNKLYVPKKDKDEDTDTLP